MNRDKVIFGGLIGIFANVAMDVLQYPLWKMQIIRHTLSHYVASLFLDFNTLHFSWIGSVTSFIADYIYGAFLGIIFVYWVHRTGKRYLLMKGLIYGGFLWLFSFGGLRSLPVVTLREYVPSQTLYYLVFHLVFGVTLGLLTERYGEIIKREKENGAD